MTKPLSIDKTYEGEERRQPSASPAPPTLDSENAMPWQIKAIGIVGVPSVIALFLVYTLVNAQAREGGNFGELLKAHITASQIHAEESKSTGERLERYLQLICVNTARTDQEKATCIVR